MVSLIKADAESLPLADNSVDLVLGSPPYLECRDYGIGASRPLDTWVPWMLTITKEAVRVSRGLVIWVMAGQTKNGYYQPGPEALLYEWYKTGGVCWNPMFWHRHGIPGSGGKQKLKNNIEYVFGFTKHKKLPWADNLATGHPPKYKTGGGYSYRSGGGDDERVSRPRRETKVCNPGNVFFVQVGGNKMGSEWASQNEAPYPEKLCEPIIKTYCPPGGVCYDPFMGSGTTVAVALKLGRNAIGSDIRMSELVKTHCRIDGISVADYKLGHRPIFDMLGG